MNVFFFPKNNFLHILYIFISIKLSNYTILFHINSVFPILYANKESISQLFIYH